ncbi:MAG: Rieske (2Fe-2S) protein [Acidobacteriota bacterium]
MSRNIGQARTEEVSRRGFLGTLAWLFTGLIGLVMAATGSLFAIFPAFKGAHTRIDDWRVLVSLDQVPEGQPTKYNLTLTEHTGWMETNTQQAVWVVRRGQSVDIFSAVCPHEGCTISHEPKSFICRCHSSQWQEDGHRVAGPTPRDLDRLDYRINNNQVEVRYQNFKRGVAEKIPLA